jgi:hypothetical protein
MKLSGLFLLVILASLQLLACGNPASAGEPGGCSSTGFPYCMTIASGHVTPTPTGFGYSYSGTMTFAFSPALPSNMGTINLVFNASSMSATTTANGSSQLTFAVGGNSIACQLFNPTTVDAFQEGGTTALATESINWNPSGC